MIEWTNKKPTKQETGRYLVVSNDGNGNLRVDIEYWDGYNWDNIDVRNIPVKWCKIEY